MRVALCGFDLSMTKDALHLVEAAAIVYQKAGEAVSEVVHTYVVESSLAASRVPRIGKTGKRLKRFRVSKYPLASFWNRLKQQR